MITDGAARFVEFARVGDGTSDAYVVVGN